MVSKRRRKTELKMWALCGVALAPAGAALADPPSGDNYRLVFADEFNGNSLDTSKWTAASPSWTMPNSNSSASASDVTVGNGVLTLTANRPTSAASFDSGSISSYGKFQYTGGYIEARIKLPTTLGSWPAFWGLYTGWPPEADIMEYPLSTNGGTNGLSNTQYNTNYHYATSGGGNTAGAGVVNTGTNLGGTYHTFGMDWVSSTSVAFYLDGVYRNSYTGSSVSQMAYMYMILDYAVGGWPLAPSLAQWPVGHSDTTVVDWVRVWQANPNADAQSNWNISGGGSFTTAANWTSAGVPAFGDQVAYFGRVGTAPTAPISMGAWQLFGGITFDGLTTGTLAGTTAYTLGATSNQIQLASVNSSGGTVTIQATAASTANQTINAGVELWSNTEISNNMTGGQTLTLNGNLSGAGTLNVDGTGTVVLAGTGSYSGTTTIGSNQGPAVLLAEGNSALSTGTVIIGTAGNSTTAKLELGGGITLPNPIDFRGRNNTSVGIENISGNNTLSGTVSANVGGAIFQIQSDAGTLTLSGTASSGVAIQSTTGSRTFTLQGAGNGMVSGKIQNGGGSVSILEAGPGIWSLSAANTYTGLTTISGGTLQLLGTITPVASYSFSPGTVSGTTVTNTGSGGSAMNAVFSANGGSGFITTTGGALPGTGALALYGNGSYLTVNSPVTSLANTSSWTISAWVKTNQPGFTILDKGTAGSNWGASNSTFYLGVQGQSGTASGGVPVAVRYGGGWLSGSTSPQVDNGGWHLVTYADNGTTETVYVDGVAETTSQGFGNGDIGNQIRFGIGGPGESDGQAVSYGSIGAINIFNSALTPAQIQGLYTSNTAGIGTTNILPSTSPVSLTSSSAVLDLESVNQTVASLSGPAGSSVILGKSSSLTINSNGEFDGSVTGNGSLSEASGITFTLGGTNVAYTGSTTIGTGALLNLPANSSSGSILTRMIGAVSIGNNGKITLAPAASHATRQLLVVPSVTIAGSIGSSTGLINLADNDMIVQGTGPVGLATLTSEVNQGYNTGTWQGSGGITSSVAAANTAHLTALGVIQNDNGTGTPLYSTFDQTAVGDADVLLKYTYYGDTNLDGQVDGSDYSRIDASALLEQTTGPISGWYNGDFNYDGIIDGSDYTLLDNSFNSQGAALTTQIARSTAEIAGTASVPEPASLAVLGVTGTLLLGRRRRGR